MVNLTKKEGYLSHDSQQLLFNCYRSLAICTIHNAEPSLEQINKDYTEFTHSLLLEYRGICRKLKLEEPVI